MTANCMSFGALLLSSCVDGAFGTEVDADLIQHANESLFRLDVTLPYDKSKKATEDEDEVFLRYLTAVDVPRELFNATTIGYDLANLFALDSPEGRSRILTNLEIAFGK